VLSENQTSEGIHYLFFDVLVIDSNYFVYMENKESLYTMEYMLTTLLLFISVIYLAYFIKNIFSGKYNRT